MILLPYPSFCWNSRREALCLVHFIQCVSVGMCVMCLGCVCARVQGCACARACVHTCAHAYGSQRWTSREASLQSLSPLFVETVFWRIWSSRIQTDWPASCRILLPSPLGLRVYMCTAMLAFTCVLTLTRAQPVHFLILFLLMLLSRILFSDFSQLHRETLFQNKNKKKCFKFAIAHKCMIYVGGVAPAVLELIP